MYAFEVKRGLRLNFGEGQWTVEEVLGSRLRLRNSNGKILDVDTVTVLSDPNFYPVVPESQLPLYDPRAIILDTVDDGLKLVALALEEHINEFVTGYRSGQPERAQPDEPRPLYDPDRVPMMSRLRHKAQELVQQREQLSAVQQDHLPSSHRQPEAASRSGSSAKLKRRLEPVEREMERLRKLRQNYQKLGLIALIDRRQLKQLAGPGRHHPEVVSEARTIVKAQVKGSNRTRLNLSTYLRQKIEDRKDEVIPLQSERSLRRLVTYVGKLYRLHNSAPTRRSLANRPQRMYQGVIATRPGEYVLIDVSPGDFMAIDPLSLQAKRYKLVVALDLYSRSVLSARLLPNSERGIDLSFTLYDIITPKRMMPGWPTAASYPYVGVPGSVVLRVHGLPDDTSLAGIPFVVPQTVVIDNGRPFRSTHFRNVCHLLGISLLYSRPYTPTDKPQIERFFLTFEQSFAQHYPSYLGSNVSERGDKPEELAVHFVQEIETKIGEWIAIGYQRQVHSALFHQDVPGAVFTPNDFFDLGMKEAGLIVVPFGKDIYYQLLETVHRKINDYGVQVDYLYYDHPELQALCGVPSTFKHLNGEHPFKRDPRDLRYLYFLHPVTGIWLRLTRRSSKSPDAPFTSEMLRRARLMALKQGGSLHDPEEVSASLDALVRSIRSDGQSKRKQLKHLREMQNLLKSETDRSAVLGDEPITAPEVRPPALAASGIGRADRTDTFASLDLNTAWNDDFDFSDDPA